MEQNVNAQSGPSAAPVEISSFGTRAVNVLTAPGELYAEVAVAPVQTSSWLIPFLVLVAIVVLLMYSMTNNPSLFDQMMEPQRAEMARQVASGEVSAAQAEQASQYMENKGIIFAFGSLTVVFFTTAVVFGAPLVYWLVSKAALKFTGGYRKILEVYGLSMVIGIVGTLVALIMMNMMDSLYAQPSGAFFLRDAYEQENFGHNFLATMNVFSLWQVAVTGIGLSAVSGKGRGPGMAVAFGLWLVYAVCASFLGWGAR